MKKYIAILLMLLLCVQAIPLTQFLQDDDVTYSWVDEDKPEEIKAKEKKVVKEFCSAMPLEVLAVTATPQFADPVTGVPPAPHLDVCAPPPDRAC